MQTLKKKKQVYCSQVCRSWCCKNLIMRYDLDEKDIDKFFALRNIIWDKDHKQIVVPSKCKWLTSHNKCRLYAWRPDSCRQYECDKIKSMTIDS